MEVLGSQGTVRQRCNVENVHREMWKVMSSLKKHDIECLKDFLLEETLSFTCVIFHANLVRKCLAHSRL